MKSFLALLFILPPLCHSAAIQDSTPVAANWPRAWRDCAFNHYCDDNRDCRSQKDCLDKVYEHRIDWIFCGRWMNLGQCWVWR
ncbi:hypothetical protein GX48_08218, partial [Paracoccidioides brasiliensis]